MSAEEDLRQAEKYNNGDILAILYRQHASITLGLDQVTNSTGDTRRDNFDAVTAYMKAHETAEQQIVRPVVEADGGGSEAEARNAEESKADQLIAELKSLDVESAEFESRFAELKSAVTEHAETEEREEFPLLEKSRSEDQRIDLGRQFQAVRLG